MSLFLLRDSPIVLKGSVKYRKRPKITENNRKAETAENNRKRPKTTEIFKGQCLLLVPDRRSDILHSPDGDT